MPELPPICLEFCFWEKEEHFCPGKEHSMRAADKWGDQSVTSTNPPSSLPNNTRTSPPDKPAKSARKP